jgi:hypothetical protein
MAARTHILRLAPPKSGPETVVRIDPDSLRDDRTNMTTILASDLPDAALLQRYKRDGAYTDCYRMDLPRDVSMAEYIAAFYTTWLFKIERRILALALGKHSTDDAAQALALGNESNFAAWSVEDRSSNQLLLCDFLGRTRSWLMVEPVRSSRCASTRLYFGSAVVPKSGLVEGNASFGFAFHAFSGFHHVYSRALLRVAHAKLSR